MTRHTLQDLAAGGHLTRIAESEYAYLRECGEGYDAACIVLASTRTSSPPC